MRTVFEAAGGISGLRRLAEAWHHRVMADDVVSHAFSHGFHPQHVERLSLTASGNSSSVRVCPLAGPRPSGQSGTVMLLSRSARAQLPLREAERAGRRS